MNERLLERKEGGCASGPRPGGWESCRGPFLPPKALEGTTKVDRLPGQQLTRGGEKTSGQEPSLGAESPPDRMESLLAVIPSGGSRAVVRPCWSGGVRIPSRCLLIAYF